jgi:hypothetical protein
MWPTIGALAINGVGGVWWLPLAALRGRNDRSDVATRTRRDHGRRGDCAAASRWPGSSRAARNVVVQVRYGPDPVYVREDQYVISAGGSAQGDIGVDGDEVAFFNSNGASCPPDPLPDIGRYRWRVTGQKLHLRAIGEDPCSGRAAAVANTTLERVG